MENKRDKFAYAFDIDFRKYFRILSQQKSFIVVFCLSSVISSLALTYFFSEKYIAAVNLYYQPVEKSRMYLNEKQVFGAPAPSPPFKVIVQTLQDIIKSDALLVPVVEQLRLDQALPPDPAQAWYVRLYQQTKDAVKAYGMNAWSLLKFGRIIDIDPGIKALQKLRENIQIKMVKESYVYTLSVKDKFPQRSAMIADTLGQKLVFWLKEQDATSATNRLEQLQEQLAEKQNLIKGLREQREALLLTNDITSISEEVARGVASLYEIKSDQIRLRGDIEKRKDKITSFNETLAIRSSNFIDSDNRKKIETDKLFQEIELGGLKAQNTALASEVQKMQHHLKTVLSVEKNIERLNMLIEAEQREYIHIKDLYLENLSQTMSSASEVRVMNHAAVPMKPVQPVKIYHVGVTALLSLFLATGLVYVFAFFNIRIFFASQGVKGRKREVQS